MPKRKKSFEVVVADALNLKQIRRNRLGPGPQHP
jgi:hypothetical protein